jgi:uncharacterized metal-binding protein
MYACGGADNVGQIGNDAVRALDQLRHGVMCCPLAIAAKHPLAVSKAAYAAKRLVVDGCDNCCLQREFEANGLPVDVHFVVTSLGIEKKHTFNYGEEQVAAVASAIHAAMRG